MRILHVVGARPNFVKAAPVIRAFQNQTRVEQLLLHTGQHYDERMSDVFFRDLNLPKPDLNLEVGSDSHARQTATIMIKFESVALDFSPDLVCVYGDVNSTVAAALVCAKLGIRIAHVEAGLRSYDRQMPEEINRLITDQISDLLFTPSADADENLRREGIFGDKVHRVGNVMIDTLVQMIPLATEDLLPHNLKQHQYGLITLHRPSNVDDAAHLVALMTTLDELSNLVSLVFPIHPRTLSQLQALGWRRRSEKFYLVDPMPYIEFLAFQRHATFVITDSGGIQEETTYLGIPCFTVRENTERPITVTLGTNVLVGKDFARLRAEVHRTLLGDNKPYSVPPLWDGYAASRIRDFVLKST